VDPLRLLREGELEVRGRLTVSSNAALVGVIGLAPPDGQPGARLGEPDGLLERLLGDEASSRQGTLAAVVYKPIAFERPLWDFPDGTLAHREVAAYLVSEASGWGIVPPTILRDGPAGPGMVQLWLDEDPSIDAWELVETADPRLRSMALLDAVVNNTDRKGGHILPVRGGDDVHLYGVDHGVCFSIEPKLRTVLWAWRGSPIEPGELAVLGTLRTELDGALGSQLLELLDQDEVETTRVRLDELLASGRFPEPPSDWPAVPWPPY
jgi:uncharacterized repeat protein (TIGR03843 family)